MPKYIITRGAQDDINEILVYIAADNLDAALSFNDRLTDLFEMLITQKSDGNARS